MESAKKNKKRKILSNSETAKFIEIWTHKIAELRGQRKNSHILKEMGTELQDSYGIVLSMEEVRTRINNLTKRYRKEKQMTGKSGGSPSEWEFYNEIAEFIGEFKANRLDELVVESIDEENSNTSLLSLSIDVLDFDYSESSTTESWAQCSTPVSSSDVPSFSVEKTSAAGPSLAARPSNSTRPKNRKRGRDGINEAFLEVAKEEAECFKDFVDQSKKNEEERIELLRENINLQKKLLEFFTSNKK